MAGGVDGHMAQHPGRPAGERVDLADALDLVSEILHPHRLVPVIGGKDLHRVPPDTEHIPLKSYVVALVSALDELEHQRLLGQLGAGPEGDGHFGEVVRLAQAVNAAHRRHHDHVPPLQQGEGGAQPKPVDLLIGGGVLFDVGVRVGDVGLGLVVVVVGDKILHCVVGEELLELAAQLGSEGLVVGQHQGGLLHPLDDLGHGVGLAGAGDAQQGLLLDPQLHAPGEHVDGLGLIAGGRVFAYHLKVAHGSLLKMHFN